MEELEAAALRIAQKKLSPGSADGRVKGPRFGTGGHFSGIFLWDTAFTALWAKYHRDTLPVTQSLDNLYRLQNEQGFICREYAANGSPAWPSDHPIAFAPPVLAWAELDFYELHGDRSRLSAVFGHLVRHHEFCRQQFQQDDGLYIGDPWGCGMDNLPRWPRGFTSSDAHLPLSRELVHETLLPFYDRFLAKSVGRFWNRQGRYIDMSAQMTFDALCLARMAAILDDAPAENRFREEHRQMAAAINEHCWSEASQFYFDLGDGQQIERFHIGAFWMLLAEAVPDHRRPGFLRHLSDSAKFARPVPVPVLAADDVDYREDGLYWRGSSWPPTTYMVLRGLRAVGADEMAAAIAARYVDAVRLVLQETGTFWENLAPEQAAPGDPAGPDFCGWAGLGPVAIPREFL